MSKYEPLKRYLQLRSGSETPMSFPEVERVLGFELPPSARQYPAWWSNNLAHVGARAWREAGWKASRLDIGSERVTFVREEAPPFTHAVDTVQPPASEVIVVPRSILSRSALRMLDDVAEETGFGRAEAVAAILEASAVGRRRTLLETLSVATMPAGHDSTAMIRQDRDER